MNSNDPFVYHPTRVALAMTRKRFAAVPAGRGSGKTAIAKRRLKLALREEKEWPDPRYLFCAPTESQAKFIAWDDMLQLIPPNWIAPNGVSLGELKITTIFGSSLRIGGLDRPQRFEGKQYDGIVIDESSDIKPGAFDRSLLPALTWRNGWCWRMGVPKRFGIGAKEFKKWCDEGASGKIPDRATYAWTSADILDKINPQMLAYAKAHMDTKDYNEQFNARWETTSGRVFHAFSMERNCRPCTYDPRRPIIVGQDFNVDPMAWAIGHNTGNGIEWFDELFLRNANTQSTLDVLYSRYATHRAGWEFYPDASSRQRKTSATETDYLIMLNDERFRAAGMVIIVDAANPPVRDRLANTNALLCSANGERRMFVDPRCVNLIDDLQNRHTLPGEDLPNDKGDAGHITDAIGYAVNALYPIKLPDVSHYGLADVRITNEAPLARQEFAL